MSAARQVTFGKRGAGPVSSPTVSGRRVPLAPLIVAGFALVLVGGAIAIALSSAKGLSVPLTTTASVSATAVSLTGVWAANAEPCDVAKMKIELDGTNMSAVSALGKLPIGPYTLSGTDPITLTFANGDHVVWDARYENKLIPISIVPENGEARLRMMHLTRC